MAFTRIAYLDNAATTPLDPAVLDAMLPHFRADFGNPSSQHALGRRASQAIECARESVASLIGASPHEIIFTSGATESINLALKGVFGAADPNRRHLITAATEHRAVLDTTQALIRSGARVTVLPVDRDGRVQVPALVDAMDDETVLISLMTANNETGTSGPLEAVVPEAARAGVLVHTDATQAIGKIPVDVGALPVDLMSFSAHKFHGPKGIGALFVRRDAQALLEPLIDGGGHERGLRSGTLNVPAIAGFGAAARLAKERLSRDSRMMRALRDRLENAILSAFPQSSVNGSTHERLPNITNLHLPGVDADSLVLAMHDVAVSSGSACTSASPSPSHVLLAMGVGYEAAGESVRFSLGRFTTVNDVDHAIERVTEVGSRLKEVPTGVEPG